ncbi:DUF6207 family protein [Streptomyces sp. NPDC056821]|uniref:DUF6207 family protein n=1 Tax=unclassified Streptomyces TaxID=2593676 RepID=UPI00367DA0A8
MWWSRGRRWWRSRHATTRPPFAVQELLAARWATAAAGRTIRDPGQPGVRLRC